MRRRTPLLLGTAIALAAAAPGYAADHVVGTDETDPVNPKWAPAALTVQPGDKVVWTFATAGLPHNLIATSGNWTKNEPSLPPGGPPTEWTFATSGIYTYICQIHGTSMTGTITVGNPPPPPPPPLSEQPFPNDTPAPGAPGGTPERYEVGGLDTTRPRLAGLETWRSRGRLQLRFRVSEEAAVTVRISRRGKRVKVARIQASGRGAVTLRRLAAGRYTARLRAVDPAGNTSAARIARFTVR